MTSATAHSQLPSTSHASPNCASPNYAAPYFFGVDVGGTNIKIGLVDNQGLTVSFASIATQGIDGAHGAVRRAVETCRKLAADAKIQLSGVVRAGVGTPGPMSLAEGKLLNPSNLPEWHDFPVQQVLATELNKPVSFINDANAAALGEAWVGAGKGHRGLAFFTLGTGVGGGLISEGQLINGINSFGSELGHIVVDSRPDARLCVWGGGRGHLEAYASASAVAEQAKLGLQAGVESSLRDLVYRSTTTTKQTEGEITAKDVHQAALAGDLFSLKLIDEAAFYLGIGVTCAVHAIDPGLVLLGGAMTFGGQKCEVGRRFLQGVIDEFERRTFANVFAGTKIDFATLGGDAGYVGAAAVARQDYQNSLRG